MDGKGDVMLGVWLCPVLPQGDSLSLPQLFTQSTKQLLSASRRDEQRPLAVGCAEEPGEVNQKRIIGQ
jgi:hypothetical protein